MIPDDPIPPHLRDPIAAAVEERTRAIVARLKECGWLHAPDLIEREFLACTTCGSRGYNVLCSNPYHDAHRPQEGDRG